MYRILLGVATALIAFTACQRSAADARPGSTPIFREIFVIGDTLRLGQVWRGAAALRAAPADSIVALRRGTFAGPASISVHLSRGDTVKALSFEYAPSASYEAMVAEYTQSLGRPLRRVHVPNPGNGPSDIAVWEDRQTSLRLMRGEVGGVSRVASALFDRRLTAQ